MSSRGIRANVRRLFRLPLDRRERVDADADEELDTFLEARTDDLIALGMTRDAARTEALRRLSGESLADVREHLHHSASRRERRMRVRELVDDLRQDLRFGVRQLAREPGFTAVAALTLALGIGANTAIFGVVNAVLLRRLPVERPEELVAIGKTTAVIGHTTGSPRGDLLSFPLYRELRDRSEVVSALAATGTAGRLDVRLDGELAFEHPIGRFVSGNYFTTLGVPAAMGRVFGPAEDGAVGGSPAAVISDAYWRRRFAAARDVVGRTIDVDGAALTIVGVAKQGFSGDIVELPVDVWLPITMQPVLQPHAAPIEQRGTSWLLLLGRLRKGVTLTQARAEFTTLVRGSLTANAPSAFDAAGAQRAPVIVTSGAQGFSAVRRTFRAGLVTLQAAVMLLLVIVCTNLASLLVARGAARSTEISVRLALGASRRRIVRQLLTESALIAALGGTTGFLLAWWGNRAMLVATSSGDKTNALAGLDSSALLFTIFLAGVAVLGFGLAPALRTARRDLASHMRAGGRSLLASGRHGRVPIGRMLVPLQVTVSVVLLTGAALLNRSLLNLEATDPGVDHDHLIIITVDAAKRGVTGDRFIRLAEEISEKLAALPGVRGATYSQNGLFTGSDASAMVNVPGFNGRTTEDSSLQYDLVGPGYVHAVGGRLLRGRDIGPEDRARTASVAVVNQSMERFYFGASSAIGRRIFFDPGVPTTIVGVVADMRQHSVSGPSERRAYAPYVQQISGNDPPFLAFELRTAGDPSVAMKSIPGVISAVDPELPVTSVMPLSTLVRGSIQEERLVARIAAGFGVAALMLVALGLYGVMSYAVARRTGEIGLRSALGARRHHVLHMVLGDAWRLVALGVAVGLPLALLCARLIRAQLHGVAAADPLSLALAHVVMLGAALLAALAPALRATRVAPAVALRQE